MKDGDFIVVQYAELIRIRNTFKMWWLAVGGEPYEPDWIYWEDFRKGNRN